MAMTKKEQAAMQTAIKVSLFWFFCLLLLIVLAPIVLLEWFIGEPKPLEPEDSDWPDRGMW